MRTMTLNLTGEEMEVLENMALSKGMTKTAIMRQALRLYQLVDKRLSEGWHLRFDNDEIGGCMGDSE